MRARTLVELDAVFLRCVSPNYWCECDFALAQGIRFLCPKCFEHHDGPVGTHSIVAWFKNRGVPDDVEPLPGRWTISGRGLSDLTLSPSILISVGCCWHGFVTAGSVR